MLTQSEEDQSYQLRLSKVSRTYSVGLSTEFAIGSSLQL